MRLEPAGNRPFGRYWPPFCTVSSTVMPNSLPLPIQLTQEPYGQQDHAVAEAVADAVHKLASGGIFMA